MLRVGIHENVIVHKAARNDRGTLIVGMKKVRETNFLQDLNQATDSTSFDEEEQDFLFFPFNAKGNGNEPLDSQDILLRIGEVKDPLNHILQQYMTKEEIKWDMFAGTGVTQENILEKVKDEATLTKVYNNIVDQFIKMVTPFLGKTDKKFRAIFPRQSADKHYPTIRRRYLGSNPFLESMTVPVEQSKIRFSKYEIEKKLNDPTPVQRSTPRESAPKADVSGLFKS